MRLRLLAVPHFKSGKNRAEIARMLNISRIIRLPIRPAEKYQRLQVKRSQNNV